MGIIAQHHDKAGYLSLVGRKISQLLGFAVDSKPRRGKRGVAFVGEHQMDLGIPLWLPQ